jgi:hypothetical protein
MMLEQLRAVHHRLDLRRVQMLSALYRGGKHVLEDAEVLNRVFPKYGYETAAVYDERCRRAFYENVFQLVINMIAAGLAQDPIHFEEEPTDDYWKDLITNATALSDDGSSTRTFDQVVRDVIVEALVCGWSWCQTDMPRQPEQAPASRADQQRAGLDRAYLISWPTSHVTDWGRDQQGTLVWLKTYSHQHDTPRADSPKDAVIHTWTVWDADGWTQYVVRVDKNNPMPGDKTLIPVADSGKHSFGRCPWVMFDVSHSGGSTLWLGDVIESLCRNYFNRQNGEAFQWTQYNYQQLYEFLGPEVAGVDTVISDAQQDPSRASRRRAPGQVHVRGSDDRAEFVGPNMAGAEVGRNALKDLRDAILRIVAMMALAQDTSGAMLRRSGDSKRQDSLAQEIFLGAIGKRGVVAANKLRELLALGRGEDPDDVPALVGYARFSVSDADSVINQSVLVEGIDIPSATYQREQKYQLAITHLGDNVSSDVKAAIREELEQAITQDAVMLRATIPPPRGSLGDPSGPVSDAPPGFPDGGGGSTGDGDGSDQPPPDQVAVRGGKLAIAGEQPGPTDKALPEEIIDSIKNDYPPEAIDWIRSEKWDGPERISLDEIDYSNSANWFAAGEPQKVQDQAARIASGWEKPILLVKTPGSTKYLIVDGHHRSLAYAHNEKSALAYVATVSQTHGPWDEMHDQQTSGPSGVAPEDAPAPKKQKDDDAPASKKQKDDDAPNVADKRAKK